MKYTLTLRSYKNAEKKLDKAAFASIKKVTRKNEEVFKKTSGNVSRAVLDLKEGDKGQFRILGWRSESHSVPGSFYSQFEVKNGDLTLTNFYDEVQTPPSWVTTFLFKFESS